jgi:hypothetical protein
MITAKLQKSGQLGMGKEKKGSSRAIFIQNSIPDIK